MSKEIKTSTNNFLIGILVCLAACNPKSSSDTYTIPADSVSLAKGENIFSENCTSCHSFRSDGIGPQLGGLTTLVSPDWIRNFIKNPKAVIESGDERAEMLYEKYKTIMPSFDHYSAVDLDNIIAFLNVKKAPKYKDRIDPNAIKDPIPKNIPMSEPGGGIGTSSSNTTFERQGAINKDM